MFRIECFCDDKKLSKALWALTTIGVYNVTSAPVVNAKKTANGELQPRQRSGTLLDAFITHVRRTKVKEITPVDMKRFCEKNGRTARGYSNLLRDAIASGLLVRVGDEYRYRVKTTTKRKATKETS
jgi:hypothetical protein